MPHEARPMIPPTTSPTMKPKIQLEALAAGSLSRACSSSPIGSTTISGDARSVVSAAGTSTVFAVEDGCCETGRRVLTGAGAAVGALDGAGVGAGVGLGVFGAAVKHG